MMKIRRAAYHLIDIGPRAGVHGGEIVAQGKPEEVIQNKKLNWGLLAWRTNNRNSKERRKGHGTFLEVVGARHNNLKT